MRCPSEESLPTELCEGPVPNESDAAQEAGQKEDRTVDEAKSPSPTSQTVQRIMNDSRMEVSDRAELIERIKRGESPTWVPSKLLEGYFRKSSPSPPTVQSDHAELPPQKARQPLLPALELKQFQKPKEEIVEETKVEPPEEIQRPRSALHSGDFTEEQRTAFYRGLDAGPRFGHEAIRAGTINLASSSPPHPPPSFAFQSSPGPGPASPHERRVVSDPFGTPIELASRSRPPSTSSFGSSFILKPPTSPLVQASNNNDLDFSPKDGSYDLPSQTPRSARRNTLPRNYLTSTRSSPPDQLPTAQHVGRPMPGMRREVSLPTQAHQPRRSLSSFNSLHLSSSPQTPLSMRSRRPSVSSELSPLQHASMVGSYEESILRGRMSTTPSKPLDFVAQIGVLGKGDCKANLKCPPHVSIPFPAVFYSYGKANAAARSNSAEDNPSPYVGLIDLDNSLPRPSVPPEDQTRRRLRRFSHDGSENGSVSRANHPQLTGLDARKREKRRRRPATPKVPPGGSYRIPEKGQLQIVIKNPNKTAVKLFLVPYDLDGMEAGTKTFIRQRSYSTGPVIDIPKGMQNDAVAKQQSHNDKPTLRYLIHIHICSPSKGRYYLYKSIRVVFANRVPDGKESLRNEIQFPEPRFSVYKPTSVPANTPSGGEKAYSRRSTGYRFPSSQGGLDAMDGMGSYPFTSTAGYSQSIQPIPFTMPSKAASGGDKMDVDERQSNEVEPSSSRPTSASSVGSGTYEKLRRGDAGYGGNAFSEGSSSEASEGLLARRLRGLDVDNL